MSLMAAYEAGQLAAIEKFAAQDKTAIIASLMRALETPIPGTPKWLSPLWSGAELAVREAGRQTWVNKNIHGGIYNMLKKLKVDKAFQAAEPLIGNTAAPLAERAQYGDRKIHGWAASPLQHLVSSVPAIAGHAIGGIAGAGAGTAATPYASSLYQGTRTGIEKALGAPGPVPYGTPFDAQVAPRHTETPAARQIAHALARDPRAAPMRDTTVQRAAPPAHAQGLAPWDRE